MPSFALYRKRGKRGSKGEHNLSYLNTSNQKPIQFTSTSERLRLGGGGKFLYLSIVVVWKEKGFFWPLLRTTLLVLNIVGTNFCAPWMRSSVLNIVGINVCAPQPAIQGSLRDPWMAGCAHPKYRKESVGIDSCALTYLICVLLIFSTYQSFPAIFSNKINKNCKNLFMWVLIVAHLDSEQRFWY